MRDRTGNLPPLPSIFPDYAAPIVRTQPDGRELTMARWGMPSPVFALKGKKSDTAVTNVRNVKSPHLETLAWGRELVCRAFHKLLRERGAVSVGLLPAHKVCGRVRQFTVELPEIGKDEALDLTRSLCLVQQVH